MMKKWKDGNFIDDWTGPPTPSQEITPAGLDRAALELALAAHFFRASKPGGCCATHINTWTLPIGSDQPQAGDVTSRWRFRGRQTSSIARRKESCPGGLRNDLMRYFRSRWATSRMDPWAYRQSSGYGSPVAAAGFHC